MDLDTHESLKAFLIETESLAHAKNDEINLVSSFLEVNQTTQSDEIFSKEIRIIQNQEQNITIATTVKLPNLKFKLGELLLEILGSGSALAESLEKPLSVTLIAIRFLQRIRQLSETPITLNEARVLIEIHKMILDDTVSTIDNIYSQLNDEMKSSQIAASLHNLEMLGCITTLDGKIKLNENITIIHKGD